MSDLKEREQLKSKAIEDIDFLKSKAIEIRTILRSYFSDIQAFAPIDAALNTVTMNSTDYLDTGNIESLRNFYANFLNRFTIAARAFLHNQSNKNTQNELVESAKAFNEITNKISEMNTPKNTSVKTESGRAFVVGSDLDRKIDALLERIEHLENIPNNIQSGLNELHSEAKSSLLMIKKDENEAKTIANNVQQYINTTEQKAKELVANLEKMRDKEISVELSVQLQNKSQRLGFQSFLKLVFFLGTIVSLIAFNTEFVNIYLYKTASVSELIGDINKLNFWEVMILKLTMNIPFFILIGFALNEYSKSHKLYEEYEFRRISTITLFNNYSQLTNELNMKKEDLLGLLTISLEKIFDNPVHSIYGDKSGDKNIGLDQLEKFASIFEKMKR